MNVGSGRMHPQHSTTGELAGRGGGVRVAMLTPVGRGALAVVGVAGAAAPAVVDAVLRPRSGPPVAERADGAICFGRLQSLHEGAAEEVVVARLAADRLEIHCHGGLAAPQAVMESLARHGAAVVPWEAWVRQDLGGAEDVATEARIAIARAAGPAAARILCRQIAGAIDHEIDRITRLREAGELRAVVAACDRLLRASRVGLRLTQPWRIAIVGPVNAGKSSLLNALAGHARSLVSPLPGTTRDLVTTRLVVAGWELDIVDTAGIRGPNDVSDVERAGIARALAVQGEVDLVIHVTPAEPGAAPANTPADSIHPDHDAVDRGSARSARPATIEVVTKIDLVADHGDVTTAPGPHAAIPTSAVTGAGIDRLAARIIAALLPEATAEPDLLAGAVPFTSSLVARISALREDAVRTQKR